MKRILITDIDGTLCDTTWRDWSAENWEEYNRTAASDKPIKPMVELVSTLHFMGWYVCCLTSRSERWRELTNRWLYNNDVWSDSLIMRGDNDYSTAAEFKLPLVLDYQQKCDLLVAIDSRDDVISTYREAGIRILQP